MPAGHSWAHFGWDILHISEQDRCPHFTCLWRKIIQMFISGENSVLQNRIRALRAQNDTHCSIIFPIVFPRVVMQRHRLTCGGKSDTKIAPIIKGVFQKKETIHQHRIVCTFISFVCVCHCTEKMNVLFESCMQH